MSALLDVSKWDRRKKVVEYNRRVPPDDAARRQQGQSALLARPDVKRVEQGFHAGVHRDRERAGKAEEKRRSERARSASVWPRCAGRGCEKAVEAIAEGPQKRGGDYVSLYDFCERVDLRARWPGATIEALIKCGAFSSLKAKRSQLPADHRPAPVEDGPADAETIAATGRSHCSAAGR